MTDKPSREDVLSWQPLTDVQWMNIVNHEYAWAWYSKDDAVHEAVKMTESKCFENNRTMIAAEREVSDKLEKALKLINDQPNCRHEVEAQLGEEAWSALAEVAAIRATHTNREQAD